MMCKADNQIPSEFCSVISYAHIGMKKTVVINIDELFDVSSVFFYELSVLNEAIKSGFLGEILPVIL